LIDAGANASAKLPTSCRESKGGFKCGGAAAAEKRDDRKWNPHTLSESVDEVGDSVAEPIATNPN